MMRRITRRDRCILLALLLATEESEINKETRCSPQIQRRTWKRLLSHWSELAKRPDVRLGIKRLLQFIRDFVGDAEFEKGQDGIFSYDHIGETFGKFAINSFTITDDNFNDLGCGIYLSGSVFDHSCWPNASKYFVGKDLHVYAIRQIGSIEEVKICYNFLYQQPDKRRAELKNQYFFDCMCEVCSSPGKNSFQEDILGGYPSPPLDKKARHASEKASGSAGEALMNLAAVMNIPDKSKLKLIVKTTTDNLIQACGALSCTNTGVNEYFDRCGCLMDTVLKQPEIAAVMYELTVIGYNKIFPEGSFELLVQLRRWLDCAIESNKEREMKDWNATSKRALVAYVTSVQPYLNHAPKLRCNDQIRWETLQGFYEQIIQNNLTLPCWVENEKELIGHLQQLLKNL